MSVAFDKTVKADDCHPTSRGYCVEEAVGVRREVLIYPLMNRSRLEDLEGGFYALPDQEPLKTVSSGNDGTFSLRLDPGSYSLFVKEDGKLYANLSDGEGNVHPVEVEAGKVTEIEFKITYAAYY